MRSTLATDRPKDRNDGLVIREMLAGRRSGGNP
jgi:hypothetical protein